MEPQDVLSAPLMSEEVLEPSGLDGVPWAHVWMAIPVELAERPAPHAWAGAYRATCAASSGPFSWLEHLALPARRLDHPCRVGA